MDEGISGSLQDAKGDARHALADQFPDIAAAIDERTPGRVVSRHVGGARLATGRDERTQQRVLDDRIAAMVAPGPGLPTMHRVTSADSLVTRSRRRSRR